MSASCRVCGRQVEVSDSGQAMPPIRCEHCGKVRHGAGSDWFDHPGSFAQEQPGQCRDCLEKRAEKAERLYRREFWAAQRRKATGKCKPVEGDVFRGMREGDE